MGCLTMALARSSWTGPEGNFASRSRTHELYFLVNSQRCLPDLWSGNWGRRNDMQAICLFFSMQTGAKGRRQTAQPRGPLGKCPRSIARNKSPNKGVHLPTWGC